MINWLFGGNDNQEEDENKNQNDPTQPEFWESMGIKPIVVDTNDSGHIEKTANEVSDRIKEVVEELKKEEE